MRCSSCGTENSAQVKFCSECGSPIGILCPDCGIRIPAEAAACGGCGRTLKPAYAPAAERRQITLFFSDIAGSTELAERLDPEDLREVYARYRALCAAAITRYGGWVAQYLGDGVLAYFGFPGAHEDDAGRAVRCGMEILARAPGIAVDGSRPSLRIGIHTGVVVIGDIGDSMHPEQLALGNAPNIAARLQAEALPDTILISESTRELLAGQFALEDWGSRTLKGFSRPMQIFRVLGKSPAISRFHAMTTAHRLTPFVGRERELQQIRAAWDAAAERQGRLAVLLGEAGMGKSRLLDAAKQMAADRPHDLFEAQCSPYQMNNPLYPIVEMLERRLGIEAEMEPGEKLDLVEGFTVGRGVRTEEAAPLLANLLAVPTQDRYPAMEVGTARRLQLTIGILADLLLHSANGSPILFLIEDLHWADPLTLDLLSAMIARLPGLPVLIVGTARPGFAPGWDEQPSCQEIPVRALNADDTRFLIARIAGKKLLPLTLVQEVSTRTGGIPLFIEAVTRTLMSSGLLRELDDRYELTRPVPSGLMPATVQDSLMARIDRLGSDRRVAQAAATIGREFSFVLLREVLRLPDDSLKSALKRMVEMDLVAEEGTPPEATYTFRHALIQDAAYESLLRKTRQEFHGEIARALLVRFPEIAEKKPELLARHHEGAGQTAEAIAGWMKAGQQAKQRLALRECEAYLRKAIALLGTLPGEDPERLKLEMEAQLALGQAVTETFGWASRELETAFSRARDLCMELGNPFGLLQALNGLSGMHLLRGNLPQALETAKPVLAMASVLGEPMLEICAANLISYPAHYMGDFIAACKYAEDGLALYTLERERGIVTAYHLPCSFACAHIRAMSLWALGYPDQAIRQWEEGWARLEELSIQAATTFGLGYMLHGYFFRRDAAAVNATADQAHTRAAEEGYLFWTSQARVYRGWGLAMNGDPEAGIEDMKAAVETYHLSGSCLDTATFCLMLAEAELQAEHHEEALAALSRGLDYIARSEERTQEAELYRLQGEIHLLLGQSAIAEESLRRAIEVARAQKAKMFELRAVLPLANLLRDQGNIREVIGLLQPLDEWFTEGRDLPELCELRSILEVVRIPEQSGV